MKSLTHCCGSITIFIHCFLYVIGLECKSYIVCCCISCHRVGTGCEATWALLDWFYLGLGLDIPLSVVKLSVSLCKVCSAIREHVDIVFVKLSSVRLEEWCRAKRELRS